MNEEKEAIAKLGTQLIKTKGKIAALEYITALLLAGQFSGQSAEKFEKYLNDLRSQVSETSDDNFFSQLTKDSINHIVSLAQKAGGIQ